MIRSRALLLALSLVLPATVGVALDLSLPAGARQVSSRISPLDSYFLPTSEYRDGDVAAIEFEGRIERQTWRVDGGTFTALQLLAPLRAQIEAAGFEVIFECTDRRCGGFDFRFAIEVVPAPDMHVDIRNFRFLSARKGADQAISVLASRSRSDAYIQVIHTGPPDGSAAAVIAPDQPPNTDPKPTGAADPFAVRLERKGHVVLDGLAFETGAGALGAGPFSSLADLGAYLSDHPGATIADVGHTDSVGALDRNIALSKKRAAAVRDRLITRYGANPARVRAEGMGYLAPVASNLTAAGRSANRRVEVILLSLD